jgi:hypothetical protein
LHRIFRIEVKDLGTFDNSFFIGIKDEPRTLLAAVS